MRVKQNYDLGKWRTWEEGSPSVGMVSEYFGSVRFLREDGLYQIGFFEIAPIKIADKYEHAPNFSYWFWPANQDEVEKFFDLVEVFQITDINPYNYNCGHYPEWVVEKVKAPRTKKLGKYEFKTEEEAKKEASERNQRSNERWKCFLNG